MAPGKYALAVVVVRWKTCIDSGCMRSFWCYQNSHRGDPTTMGRIIRGTHNLFRPPTSEPDILECWLHFTFADFSCRFFVCLLALLPNWRIMIATAWWQGSPELDALLWGRIFLPTPKGSLKARSYALSAGMGISFTTASAEMKCRATLTVVEASGPNCTVVWTERRCSRNALNNMGFFFNINVRATFL